MESPKKMSSPSQSLASLTVRSYSPIHQPASTRFLALSEVTGLGAGVDGGAVLVWSVAESCASVVKVASAMMAQAVVVSVEVVVFVFL